MARRAQTSDVVELVGYLRVSDVRNRVDERFKSPTLQRNLIERWAIARYGKAGHRWIGWFTDLDRSGITIDRPELNKARDLAIEHRARIAVMDLNRWARNVPEGLDALARLKESHVTVLSATEDFDADTPEGEMTLHLFMVIGQYQAKVIGRKWRDTIASNKSEGWWHGAAPYGYRRPTTAEAKALGRSSGVLLLDDVAAEHVRELFRRYLAGESLYALGQMGVAKGWFKREMTVKSILGNPAYAGMVPVDGEYEVLRARRGPARMLKDDHGRPRKLRVSERYVRGAHAPIVGAKDIVRARTRLAAEARRSPGPAAAARWSGAGLTRCSTCRRALTFQDKSKVAANGYYLTCGNKQCAARPGSVRVHELEVLITEMVKRLAVDLRTEVTARAVENERRRAVVKVDRHAVEAKRGRLRGAIAKAAADRLLSDVDGLSTEEVDAGLVVLRRELAEVDALIENLPLPEAEVELVELADQTEDLASLWPRMTNDERVAALRAMGVAVVVGPSRRHGDDLDGRVWIETRWRLDQAAVEGA